MLQTEGFVLYGVNLLRNSQREPDSVLRDSNDLEPSVFSGAVVYDELCNPIDAPPFPIKVMMRLTLLSQATSRGQPVSGLGMRWSTDRYRHCFGQRNDRTGQRTQSGGRWQ